MGKLLLILTALVDILWLAQIATTTTSAVSSPVLTPVNASSWVFDVSTVKRSKSGSDSSQTSFQNGRFTASNVSLRSIIRDQAFGLPERQIVGGPKWLGSESFDIEAKCDSSVADQLKVLDPGQRRAQTQAMFQELLKDRFKLVVHWETRTLPVYVLVVERRGGILQETKEPQGFSGVSMSIHGSTTEFTAQGVTIIDLAQALTQELSNELGRVVLDKTKINGRYDITLKWTPDADAHSIANGTGSSIPAPDSGLSIFTAIQEQIGLKLQSAHGPVQVLVIDHIEIPSEN